jgi:outer membrane protein OmpA-like peptidoglycan-associated protein
MKHIIALVLLSAFTFAQDAQSPWKLTLGASGLEFFEKNDTNQIVPVLTDNNVLSTGLNFSAPYLELSRHIFGGLSLNIGYLSNKLALEGSGDIKYSSFYGGAVVSGKSLFNLKKLDPSIRIAAGYANFGDEPKLEGQDFDGIGYLNGNIGFGLSYKFADKFSAELNLNRKVYSKELSNILNEEGTKGASSNEVTIGLSYHFGSTDSDGDGIKDSKDACPNDAGPENLSGCPDDDKDGIINKDDACPNKAGLAAFNGCPDTDKDGITDKEDACPEVFGDAAFGGCPDSDGDGIIDSEDNCPNQAGESENNGCPWSDSDSDGVLDKDDNCPNVAGSIDNSGCPDVKLDGFSLKFDTDKAELSQRVKEELAAIYSKLSSNPTVSVIVEGHADETGPEGYNQTLSEKRATSVVEYLIQLGVSADRLSTKGYGETAPLTDNKTSEGRAANRRVEFKVQ